MNTQPSANPYGPNAFDSPESSLKKKRRNISIGENSRNSEQVHRTRPHTNQYTRFSTSQPKDMSLSCAPPYPRKMLDITDIFERFAPNYVVGKQRILVEDDYKPTYSNLNPANEKFKAILARGDGVSLGFWSFKNAKTCAP